MLLSNDDSLTIDHFNLQKLATEVVKVKIGVTPVIMNNAFDMVHSSDNNRNETTFWSKNIHTARYDNETESHIRTKILNLLPNKCKMSTTLEEFKVKGERKNFLKNC